MKKNNTTIKEEKMKFSLKDIKKGMYEMRLNAGLSAKCTEKFANSHPEDLYRIALATDDIKFAQKCVLR